MKRALRWRRTFGALAICLGFAGGGAWAQERVDPRDSRDSRDTRDVRDIDTDVSPSQVERSRTTISLERWGADHTPTTRNVEVTDLEGRDLSRETQQQVIDGQLRLSRPALAQFVVRPADVVTMRMPAERTVLPGGVVRMAETVGAPDVWFRPTIVASPLPVTWNADRRRYSTGVLLGLQVADEAAGAELERPVTMRLGFRGMTAEPVADITLAQAGVEHEQRIDLHFLPTTETPMLELRSMLGNADIEIEALPRLELRPVARAIPGFGLGTVAVDVVRVLPHGAPAPVSDDTVVSLEIDGGARPEPDRVVLRRGSASERFTLRSGNIGPATITATAGGLSDRRTVEQELPLAPLIAALLGGALGGYSRRFQTGAGAASGGARTLEGTAVALVAYAASVLGVGWLALPAVVAATEAGAFLIGALSGFVGVAVIEALARRLRPAADH